MPVIHFVTTALLGTCFCLCIVPPTHNTYTHMYTTGTHREEVWDLPQSAALSSCLLLLITAGAMVGSYFYERRIWCRYLCPVGGMNVSVHACPFCVHLLPPCCCCASRRLQFLSYRARLHVTAVLVSPHCKYPNIADTTTAHTRRACLPSCL